MDPLSHAVLGYAVRAAGRTPITRRLGVAAVVGALAPDLDSVFIPIGWDVYLRVHEVGTHTLLGTLPVAGAVGLVTRGRSAIPWPTLVLAAWLGALSHVALDVLCGARIRVGWPLSASARTYPSSRWPTHGS